MDNVNQKAVLRYAQTIMRTQLEMTKATIDLVNELPKETFIEVLQESSNHIESQLTEIEKELSS